MNRKPKLKLNTYINKGDLITDFPNAQQMRDYYNQFWPVRLPPKADYRLKFFKVILNRTLQRGTHAVRDIDEFDLYMMGIKQDWKCAYTGIPLEFARGGSYVNKTNPMIATMDRIDSNLPYTKDNVELVIWEYNRFKSDYPIDKLVLFSECTLNRWGIDRKACN
jgi:hypothetical protein